MSKLTSNNNKAIAPLTSAPTLPRLVYYDGTKKLYYPLITVNGSLIDGGYEYSYVKSLGDTFGIALNNTKYVVPNRVVQHWDIPAGTYSPTTFEGLIASFISQNGSRTVKSSFSVVVNGQTYFVPAGRAIYYTYQYSGQAKFVSFNGSQRGNTAFEVANGFATYGVYCTYWNYPGYYQGLGYSSYNIQVRAGINFS